MFQTFDLAADKAATPARVAALRAALAERGVDGMLIPRADVHQGEYVAPHDERLAFVTGFTGSAGIAIVFGDRAVLFVDGRYTLQAADQTDAGIFEVVPLHETPPSAWLAEHGPQGVTLGFDPWLHGKTEIDGIRTAVEGRGGTLVALPDNPVDAIWSDQPPKPAGAVRIHPAEIAGEDAAAKRARLGQAVADQGAAATLITLPDSLSWLLNVRGSDVAHSPVAQGFAVLHADGRVDLVMEPDKLGGEVLAHLGNEVAVHPPDALAGLVHGLAGPVLLDQATCPVWVADRLGARETEIAWGTDPCILPKATKNDTELQGMRAAHRRDGAAMVRFLHWLDGALAAGAALDEITIVQKLEDFRSAEGDLLDISFDTICGTGPHGAIVHYRVNRQTNRAVSPGDLVLVDSGAQYPDGTTDITRTMATGPVTGAQRRHFTLVLKGMIAISTIRWPEGLRGRDLDPLARAALWRAGLDYDHGTGHGVGACLNVHEGPQSLSRRGAAVLEPGMILSNEPGFYVAGEYGIRIENLLVVTPPEVPEGGMRRMLGFETITWCPIDRRLIDPGLMTRDERAWLDGYHAEVLTRIGPLVEGEARVWLQAACAPL